MAEAEQSQSSSTGDFDEGAFDKLAALIDDSEAGTGAIQYDRNGNPVLPEEQPKAEEAAETPPESAQPEETPEEVKTDEQEETQEESETEPEVKEVDYDQVVPMSDGEEPITIGAMKDEITALRRERRTVEMQSQELQRDRILVNAILQNPGEVTPDIKQQFEEANTAYLRRELETVQQMFPQWQDPAIKQADVADMRRVAFDAGASPQDIDMLSKPWILGVLKRQADFIRREAKAKQTMKEKVRTPPKSAANGKTPSEKPAAAVRASQFNKALAEGDFATLDKFL